MQATQGAIIPLQRWCLSLNSSKCEASFLLMDPHQANLPSFNSHLRFNPTPTFVGVTFDRTLSFSKHVSSLKAKIFPRLKALHCISASSWGPFSHMLHPGDFLSSALPILPNWNAFTEQLVAPSPAASLPPLSHFSSLMLLYLLYVSP